MKEVITEENSSRPLFLFLNLNHFAVNKLGQKLQGLELLTSSRYLEGDFFGRFYSIWLSLFSTFVECTGALIHQVTRAGIQIHNLLAASYSAITTRPDYFESLN